MSLALEFTLLLLLVLALGAWGIVSGVRSSRRQVGPPLTPPMLSALAQPYRGLMGEALSVYDDVAAQAAGAPKALSRELNDVALRVRLLVARALPRARHGTALEGYLLKLDPSDPQYANTKRAAAEVEEELRGFVETLRTLRGKVYAVLTDASRLEADPRLERDLEDALIEISALEEAFAETRAEVRGLP